MNRTLLKPCLCILAVFSLGANMAIARESHTDLEKKSGTSRKEGERRRWGIEEFRDHYDRQQKKFLGEDKTPEVIRHLYKGSYLRLSENLKTFDEEYRELLGLLDTQKEKNLFPERILAENLRNQRLRFKHGPEAARFQVLCDPKQVEIKAKIEIECKAKASSDPIAIQEMLATQATIDFQDPAVRYAIELVRLTKKAVETKAAKNSSPVFDVTTDEGREQMRVAALKAMQKDYVSTTQYNMFVSRYNGKTMGDLVSAAGATNLLQDHLRLVVGQFPRNPAQPTQNIEPVPPASNLDRIARISLAIFVRNQSRVQNWRQFEDDLRRLE